MNNGKILRILSLLVVLSLVLGGCGEVVDTETPGRTLGDFGSQIESQAESFGTIPETSVEERTLTEQDEGTRNLTERDEETGDGVGIYSYLQTISAYDEGLDWSGEWAYIQEPGSAKHFSNFGCGICCLANLYSSLTPSECTPDEMYEWCKEYSDYYGDGAISWSQLDFMARFFDFPGELVHTSDYDVFQSDMASSRAMLILVSSYYENPLWKNLPGHYVTLWQYDPETDTVFLTDSSRPKNNRTRVALSDVFKGLYIADTYQYLKIS